MSTSKDYISYKSTFHKEVITYLKTVLKGIEEKSFSTFYLTEVLVIVGSTSTSVVISGTGFSSNFSENNVIVGGVECLVTDSTTSSITCDVGNGPVGSYPILVNVDGKGYATGSVDFTYTSDIASIDPPSGSLGGKIKYPANLVSKLRETITSFFIKVFIISKAKQTVIKSVSVHRTIL